MTEVWVIMITKGKKYHLSPNCITVLLFFFFQSRRKGKTLKKIKWRHMQQNIISLKTKVPTDESGSRGRRQRNVRLKSSSYYYYVVVLRFPFAFSFCFCCSFYFWCPRACQAAPRGSSRSTSPRQTCWIRKAGTQISASTICEATD